MSQNVRSEQIENWLDQENGVRYHLETVAQSAIDDEKSLANQARLGHPLIPHLVDDYAEAAEAGNKFPPLVAWKDGVGKLVLIDGNNRLHGFLKAGKPALIDVYVVDTDDRAILDRLTRTANRRLNGDRPNRADAVQHALHRVTSFGEPIAVAAADFNVPTEDVQRAYARQMTRRRLDQLGIATSKLTDWMIYRLSTVHNDPLLAAVTHLTTDAQLTGEQMEGLIKAVREPRSEAEQLAVVDDWRERPEVRSRIERARKGSTRPIMTPAHKALMAMGNIATILAKHPTADQMGLTAPGDVDRFMVKWGEAQQAISRWRNRNSGALT